MLVLWINSNGIMLWKMRNFFALLWSSVANSNLSIQDLTFDSTNSFKYKTFGNDDSFDLSISISYCKSKSRYESSLNEFLMQFLAVSDLRSFTIISLSLSSLACSSAMFCFYTTTIFCFGLSLARLQSSSSFIVQLFC